jgi:DNA-binding transcriptional ArsR family regulator
LASDEAENALKGTTLEVYRFLLKNSKPVGIREVQRALNLSSPSLAVYHLSKLEDAGLLKRDKGDYLVNKVLLEHSIRISRFLIPRYLFYFVFAVSALIIELTFLRPPILTGGYVFSTIVTFICALAFSYETAKTWIRGGL